MKDEILDFVIQCAKTSGEIQRQYYGGGFGIHHKGEINLVTDVDFLCQEKIVEMIKRGFPNDEIISEEQINDFSSLKNRWIIDPLDGTTNYAHGYPFFCTSVAYEVNGEVVAGAVYAPIFEELFYARRSSGAFFNGKKIGVSSIDTLNRSLLCTGFPYDLKTSARNNIGNFIEFMHRGQAIRRDGSAALNLAYLACGRFDGFWELKLNPWDVAAGCLIIREAGGIITDFQGENFNMYEDDIVASNGLIHEEMLEVLREDRRR